MTLNSNVYLRRPTFPILFCAVGCLLMLIYFRSGIEQNVVAQSGISDMDSRSFGSNNKPLPFNLVPQGYDLNGIMLNPKWSGQGINTFPDPSDPNCLDTFDNKTCSDQNPTPDLPKGIKSLICRLGFSKRLNGHVNWQPATYDGTIAFNDYSDDLDFTWTFRPNNGGGLTTKNPKGKNGYPEYTHIEFNADETINGFKSKRWTQVRDGFECDTYNDPNCADDANGLTKNHRAIVTGLVGLDTEHGGYSEIHPVYALAIEIDTTPSRNSWIFFIRKRGNEGFCSSHDHPMKDLKSFVLMIPKPPNSTVTEPKVVDSDFNQTSQGPCSTYGFDPTDSGGEFIKFNFPDEPVGKPVLGPILEGEITLDWQSNMPMAPFRATELIEEMDIADRDDMFLSTKERARYLNLWNKEDRIGMLKSSDFHQCPPTHEMRFPERSGVSRITASPAGTKANEKALRQYGDKMIRDICQAKNENCVEFLKGSKTSKRTISKRPVTHK